MLCEVCESEEATVTIIPIGEGFPQSLGPGCFARAGLEFAKAQLPADEIANTLGPMFVQAPAPEIPAKAAKRGKAKGEAETPEPLAATGTDGGANEIPTAAEDA